METFSELLALCAGNSPVTGEFPAQIAWIKGLVNNGEAGDLRRHRAHYDVIIMIFKGVVMTYSSIGCQHSSPSYGRQGNMPYSIQLVPSTTE